MQLVLIPVFNTGDGYAKGLLDECLLRYEKGLLKNTNFNKSECGVLNPELVFFC